MANTIDIKYVAHLARLELSPAEQKEFAAQLGDVLSHVDKLGRVDVAGVEPTAHPVTLTNVTRPDEVAPPLPHDEAMRNAPATVNGLFLVPKIVE